MAAASPRPALGTRPVGRSASPRPVPSEPPRRRYAAIQRGLLTVEKQGKKNVFSGRVLEIEGLGHLKCEQAFELSDASAERSAAGCTIKLDPEPVCEYLRSNIVMLKWMVAEGYGDKRTLERRVARDSEPRAADDTSPPHRVAGRHAVGAGTRQPPPRQRKSSDAHGLDRGLGLVARRVVARRVVVLVAYLGAALAHAAAALGGRRQAGRAVGR